VVKKILNAVLCISFLAAYAFGKAFETPGTSMTLIIIAIVLSAIIYIGTSLTKNVICRCFRCPGLDPNNFVVRIVTAILTQIVQIMLLLVFFQLFGTNESLSG
jgi:cation transporter-like permease